MVEGGDRGVKENVNRLVHKDVCTGCGACVSRCPKICISMNEDVLNGFLFPVVDDSICIECGACLKICPILNSPSKSEPFEVYAARTKDKSILKSSNSGGIFSSLAKHIVENGGYACGAAFIDDLSVEHIIVCDVNELKKLQGSKYVQSEAFCCYKDIKKLLTDGKQVVFCGTGCQIAGLYSYLNRKYDTLLTVELVCHGVPSPGLFRKYLEWLGNKTGGKITSFKFRSKQKRPTGEHSEFFYTCKGMEYMGRSYEDPYYGSFLQGRTLRSSCYDCHFKGRERVSDITIGDFWGIEKFHKSFPTTHGHCMVMVNTEKGIKAIEAIRPMLDIVESTYEEASAVNHSLDISTPQPKIPVDYSAENLFEVELNPRLSFKNKIKNRLPWWMKMWLKRLV